MLNWQWLRRSNLRDSVKQSIIIVLSLLITGVIYFPLKSELPLQIPILGISIDDGLFTNLVSSLLIVLLIDGLRNIGADIEIRKSLIRRAASTSNETAKAAIDELRKTGLIDRGVLRGADLSGARLRGAMLDNADLSGVNLEGADLSHANFNGAILTGAKMAGAICYRTRMVKAQLIACDLMETRFDKADLTGVVLKGTLLDEVGPLNIHSAKFINTKLVNVDFSHLKTMKGSTFSKCDLQGAIFKQCTLESSDFTESDMRRAILTQANLRRCNFSLCGLDDADLQNTDLQYANITGANLSRTNLEQAILDYATYGGSVFSEAKLYSASFLKGKLGEDSEGNSYLEANFIGAKFDIRTILPDGNNWDNAHDEKISVEFGMRRIIEDENINNEDLTSFLK